MVRVLIRRVRAGTEFEFVKGEEQCGFRQCRGCMARVCCKGGV